MSADDARFIQEIVVAAEKGDAAAQARLALMYMEGWGMGPNVGEARRWYEKSAAQDEPSGHYGLACMAIFGLGQKRDLVEAYSHLLLMNRRRDVLQKRWNAGTYRQMLETFTSLGARMTDDEKMEARRQAAVWQRKYG